MKKLLILLAVFLVQIICIRTMVLSPVYAEDCDTSNLSSLNLDALAARKAKCEEAFSQMEAAKKPHVDALRKMESDIAAFQARISQIEAELVRKTAAIQTGEKELEELLSVATRRIRQFYIRSYQADLANVAIFTSPNLGQAMRVIGYQRTVTNEDKKVITQTALMVKDLMERKKALEQEKINLSALKESIDAKAVSIRKLVTEAQAYQTKLTGMIAALSAAQQSILNARSGTFTTSVGDVPLADDPNAAPNFNPGFSPAFAGFSFGAYTHRKGMSQYGAFGRAKSGQSAEEILKAYYGNDVEIKKDYDPTRQIGVSGYSRMDIESYVQRIYEVPNSWGDQDGMAALRAQAVAARSYALAWTREGSGGDICTDQGCQVFKNEPKGGNWERAVNDTKGWVLMKGGKILSAWFSSTSGGYQSAYNTLDYLKDGSNYNTPGFWDTKRGQDGWTGDAYEKIAGSPWFYKGWYTSEYYNNSAKCGRNHPWLTNEEFADIVNAWIVRKNGSGDDNKRILPVTINSCGISGASGDPFSMSELRDKANGMGGAVTSVSSVSVTYNSGGYTDTVILATNKGELRIPGGEFKESFNLRAPGYISIRSPLFNIEKK